MEGLLSNFVLAWWIYNWVLVGAKIMSRIRSIVEFTFFGEYAPRFTNGGRN